MATATRLIRKRASRPKTRTGCRTCRARHVKCGEERPACRNCSSTGRRCDGYEIGFVLVNGEKKNQRPILPESAAVVLVPINYNPIYYLPATLDDQERQAFEFFSGRTSFNLPGYASINFWERLVMQMSHVEPAMVHAVVAVGAMHYVRASALWNGNLEDVDPARHEFALQQYSKSVARLQNIIEERRQDKSNTVLIVLLACLMFIRFEMLQDCDDLVIEHIQRGLKVLWEYTYGNSSQKDQKGKLILKLNPKSTFECLTEVFVRLDCDSTMLGVTEPAFSVSVDHELSNGDCSIPPLFKSLAEARFYLETLTNAIYCTQGELMRLAKDEIRTKMDVTTLDPDWYYCLAEAGSHVVDIPANGELAIRMKKLEERASAWSTALMRMPTSTSREDYHAWLMVQIQFFLVWMQTVSWRGATEVSYDQYEETVFAQTICQAATALQSMSQGSMATERNTSTCSWPKFGLTGGVLLSIYTVAIKCRDSVMRRRAVELLRDANIQEGVFDNYNLAIYAKRIIDIEEDRTRELSGIVAPRTLLSKDVPEEARFIDVTLCPELEPLDIGRMVCARHVNSCDGNFTVEEYRFSVPDVAAEL